MNEFKVKKGLIVQGSGSVILDIQGSQGQLFSVTDNLSGSLFSVNDISGLPILQVSSDDSVKLGTFNAEAIKVSGSVAIITGSFSGSFSGNAFVQNGNSFGATALLGTNDNQSLALETSGSTRLFISSSGNVGIGTTTPNAKLDVNGNTLVTGSITATAAVTSGNTFANAVGMVLTTTSSRVQLYQASGVDLAYFDGANTVNGLTLRNTGFVGIGKTTPNAKLDVSGSAIISGSLTVTGDITGSISNAISASYATTAGNGGVTKISAGSNVNISPVNGLGDVTITSFGTNLYNTATGSYGSFYDTGSVLATSATTIYSMSLSTTDISNGVYVSASNGDVTRLKFTNAGVYDIQFSAQFSNTDNSTQDVVVWARKNGVNIDDSAGTVGVPPFKAGSNGQALGSWNYYLNLSANDYIQLCWRAEQANVITLETIAAGTSPVYPRTPSLILTAQRVDTFLSNTGSFTGTFTGSITGSLQGTASWANNALTASYADNFTVAGTITAQKLVVQTITSSVLYSSGSNIFGNTLSNTHQFTGSVYITGSSFNFNNGIGTYTLSSYELTAPSSFLVRASAGYLKIYNPITAIQLGASTGYTGIGPAFRTSQDPSAILHVSGASNQPLYLIQSPAAPSALFVSGSGNVGIGTTAPLDLLQVGASGISGTTRFGSLGVDITGNPSSGWAIGYKFRSSAGTLAGGLFANGNSGAGPTYYTIGSAYNVGLTVLQSNGNVGIGTTTPIYPLDVAANNNRIRLLGTNGYVALDLQNSANSFYIAREGSSGGGFVPGTIAYSGVLSVQGSYPMHLATNGVIASTITGAGNVGIGTTTPNAKLDVSGSATIGIATSSFDPLNLTSKVLQVVVTPNTSAGIYVRDNNDYTKQIVITPSNGSTSFPFIGTSLGSTRRLDLGVANIPSMTLVNGGSIGIGTISPSASLHVAGTTLLSSSFNTAISGSTLKVQGSGSTQPIFTVVGSQGELFSITDSLSGSLFSVNDISGLPILEVFSDNTILLGNYQAPTLYTTNRILSTALGSNVIYSFPTSSYDGVFMDYTVKSGSNARAGNFAAIWSGTAVNYMDNSTTDFGSTAGMVLSGSISGGNIIIFASGSTAGWTFKGIIKAI
jgi:hypothetical protein